MDIDGNYTWCAVCGKSIGMGQPIQFFTDADGTVKAKHPECDPKSLFVKDDEDIEEETKGAKITSIAQGEGEMKVEITDTKDDEGEGEEDEEESDEEDEKEEDKEEPEPEKPKTKSKKKKKVKALAE